MTDHRDPPLDELVFTAGFRDATIASLERVTRSALILERKMYAGEDTKNAPFRLRKALEGIWGHELP